MCSSDGEENGDGDGGDGEREVLGKDGRKGKIVLPLSSPSEFIPYQSFLRTVNVFIILYQRQLFFGQVSTGLKVVLPLFSNILIPFADQCEFLF